VWNIVDVLRDLADTRRRLDQLEHSVVALLRANGATWEQIGEELGMSRQNAQRRFGQVRKRQSSQQHRD
jgi:hypothetical protein